MAQKPKRVQVAQVVSIPAPVGGLNARDSVAAMPETDAVVLDNWFPTPTNLQLRNGSTVWATGLPAAVDTLATYNSAGGTRKMFAASNGGIYDVSAAGAVGAAAVSGQTSDWWQTINFGAGGGQYLYMVNGSDSPELFNGSTWQAVTGVSAPISITGVTTSLLIGVNEFGGRLFFIEKNSMRAWFLPALSVGGAAQSLDFSTQTRLGGFLMTMAVWTIDNSSGMMQQAAFITSEGEVLMYQGNDPTYASSWYQVGSFRVGRPVGRRCTVKIGSDVGIISADGLFPLSKALLTDRSQQQDAISNKITNLINNDVQSYAANAGWQVILYPIGNKLIVNVPNSGGTYQYVMNTITGSWCRFTGWNASCFELMGDNLFYGDNTNGIVYQCDSGYNDAGANINSVAVQAPNYFGSHTQKMFVMARPILYANANITPAFKINLDFDTSTPVSTNTYNSPGFLYWGGAWGSYWSTPYQIYRNWLTCGGVGFAGSPSMAFSGKGAAVQWQATDVAYKPGAVF